MLIFYAVGLQIRLSGKLLFFSKIHLKNTMGCAFNKFNISTNQHFNKSTFQQINISTNRFFEMRTKRCLLGRICNPTASSISIFNTLIHLTTVFTIV